MKYLHTMVRVTNLEQSLDFYCNKLGLTELRRHSNEGGRFTLVFLSAPGDTDLAYEVDDIYAACQKLMDSGVTINRPPRDGRMAFVRSPDEISIELLQKGDALPPKEPWTSMPNTGKW
jgi:lactoylglutathione lyase